MLRAFSRVRSRLRARARLRGSGLLFAYVRAFPPGSLCFERSLYAPVFFIPVLVHINVLVNVPEKMRRVLVSGDLVSRALSRLRARARLRGRWFESTGVLQVTQMMVKYR